MPCVRKHSLLPARAICRSRNCSRTTRTRGGISSSTLFESRYRCVREGHFCGRGMCSSGRHLVGTRSVAGGAPGVHCSGRGAFRRQQRLHRFCDSGVYRARAPAAAPPGAGCRPMLLRGRSAAAFVRCSATLKTSIRPREFHHPQNPTLQSPWPLAPHSTAAALRRRLGPWSSSGTASARRWP